MMRRRSMAVLLLMVVLTVAPSLARAASACAPHCCPTSAASGVGREGGDAVSDRAGDDCRSGFANRTCCADAPSPLAAFASFAPHASGAGDPLVAAPALLPASLPFAGDLLRVPARYAEAERSLRTSPLRLSVVLLI